MNITAENGLAPPVICVAPSGSIRRYSSDKAAAARPLQRCWGTVQRDVYKRQQGYWLTFRKPHSFVRISRSMDSVRHIPALVIGNSKFVCYS